MFSYIQAIIFGLVEGVTEFLPISSTGHLILTAKILGITESEFLKSFEIIIQLGAILAVLVIYLKKLLVSKELLLKTVMAFVPTGIIGFILYKVVKQYLLGNPLVVSYALIIGGICLIVTEKYLLKRPNQDNDINRLSNKKAFLIGSLQSIAMIPGVSRSATTIISGLFLGLNRKLIVEFSFFLAIPTMLSAAGYDLLKNSSSFSSGQYDLLAIGFVTSFIFAYLSVKFLLKYVSNHNFIIFGYYRILIGVVALALLR